MKFVNYIESVAQRFEEAQLFFGHGTDNAFDEAVWLVFYGLGIEVQKIDNYWQQDISTEQQAVVEDFVHQRISLRKPTAYILKRAWFAELEFIVDERVLIPRSPIAELIMQQFKPWLIDKRDYQVLDLCCGSGCIGLASVAYLQNATVDLADISREALDLAERNCKHTGLQAQSQIIQSDLFDNISDDKRYDLIVSNPPYVDAADLASMPPEYHHEPRLGLEADADGLRLVRKILVEAPNYLTHEGILIVEVGNSAEHLMNVYPQVPFIWLDFEYGGDGVFLLEAATLKAYKSQFAAAIIP